MEKKTRTRQHATLKDVAAKAGVSIAAASRVLHDRGKNIRVSEGKAQVIQEAARDLNYSPNHLAQSMRLGRTKAVGLIFENFGRISEGPLFYVEMLEGVMQELFPRGYRLIILPEFDVRTPGALGFNGAVDGIIWCKAPDDEESLAILSQSPVPVVALNSRPAESVPGLSYVACDNEHGSYLLAEHLISLGHRKVAFAQEEGEEDTPDAVARLRGFRTACVRLKVPFSEDDVVVWDKEGEAASDWLRQGTSHTALFAWNEGFASRIMKQLQRSGVRVPEDMSVAGFDSTQFCDTLNPPLTAVNQPILEMASHACRLLLSQAESSEDRRSHDVVFPCTLDVRGSTGPAGSRRA
jgi:LacI family transcriptional regulator